MKSAVVTLLAILAIATAQPQSRSLLTDWQAKIKHLEAKFNTFVYNKAANNVYTVHKSNDWFVEKMKGIVDFQKEKIVESVDQAKKAIDTFREVDIKCYENATNDINAAGQAAIINLASCQNLSIAYQDIDVIAQQAQVVVVDVLADAKVIIDGVAQCTPQIGIKKWECVLGYVAKEVKNLVEQWPDVKKFINTVQVKVNDAETQIQTCVNDPRQVSLDRKIQEALNEFDACYKKSSL